MKKLVSLFTALIFVFALTGCSLFASEAPAQTAPASESTDIAVTDTYTHHDPEGMEYAMRYAFTSGKNPPELVELFRGDYGVEFVEQIFILYADANDHALAQYEYYVFASEEDAQRFNEDALGGSMIVEGNVASYVADEEETNMIISIDKQYGSLSDDTASGYAAFTKDVDVMMDLDA